MGEPAMNSIKDIDNLSNIDLKVKMDNVIINVFCYKVIVNEGDWYIDRYINTTIDIFFVRSGSCKINLAGKDEFIVRQGEFFIIPPGIPYRQISIGTEPCVRYYMRCDIDFISNKHSEAQEVVKVLREAICRSIKDSMSAIKYFDDILNEACIKNIGFYNKIKSLTIKLIISLARAINENSVVNYNASIKNDGNDYKFLKIEKYIEDNIFDLVTVNDLSKYMSLNEKQIYRIIKEKKGISAKEFIMQIKLLKAKELLRETTIPIKQISKELGFSNEQYFNRFFRKLDGYAPGHYKSYIKSMAVSYKEDFETGVAREWVVIDGHWDIVTDGTKVYHTLSSDILARSVVGLASWNNYELFTKAKVNSLGTGESVIGIIGRYINKMNYYLFICDFSKNKIRIVKQVAGIFSRTNEKTYMLNTSIWYNIKVILNGPELKFYINGELELTALDNDLNIGLSGLIQCSCEACFDNFAVNMILAGTQL